MAKELTTTGKAQVNGNYGSSLSPQELSQHSAWIGVRVQALLDPYWDRRPSDLVLAEIVMDWMDGLSGYSQDEIRDACRAYQRGPNRGRKPVPGDILAILAADRRAKAPVDRKTIAFTPRITAEEMEQRRALASEILGGFGRGNAQ